MIELMEAGHALLGRILNPLSNNTALETLQRMAKIVVPKLSV